MNSSHLHIKFAAIVKPPSRPHLRLAKSKTGPLKLAVGTPEITPELGASNNVEIRQRPPLQPSGGAARASYLHTPRFRHRSQAIHGRSRLCSVGLHVTPEAASAGHDVHQSAVVPGKQCTGRALDQ